MAAQNNRYMKMQWYMLYALVADLGLFLLYMIFAGYGVIWLKVVTAILAALLSIGCLAFLFLTQELLRPRSLWMSVTAASILLCLVASLILNYPSPNKYAQPENKATASVSVITSECHTELSL